MNENNELNELEKAWKQFKNELKESREGKAVMKVAYSILDGMAAAIDTLKGIFWR